MMERAHHVHLQATDPVGAARCAIWAGLGLLDLGEPAQAISNTSTVTPRRRTTPQPPSRRRSGRFRRPDVRLAVLRASRLAERLNVPISWTPGTHAPFLRQVSGLRA